MNTPRTISPSEANEWVRTGKAVLLDIRSAPEFAAVHIPQSINIPLDTLLRSENAALQESTQGRIPVFLCSSGLRTRINQQGLSACRAGDACHVLEGGLNNWEKSGFPVARASRRPPMDMHRQVMVAAGALVLLGFALGGIFSPWFLGISAFVGLGLVFAGVSGFCGMALLLAKMPWNHVAVAPTRPSAMKDERH